MQRPLLPHLTPVFVVAKSGPFRFSLTNNVHEPAQETLHDPEGSINFLLSRLCGRVSAWGLTRGGWRLRLQPTILFQESVTLSEAIAAVAVRSSLTLRNGAGARL